MENNINPNQNPNNPGGPIVTPSTPTDDPTVITVTQGVAQVAISNSTAPDGNRPQEGSSSGSGQAGTRPLDAPSTSANLEGQGESHRARAWGIYLPGAAKRRLKKLIAKGVPREQALTLCRQPIAKKPVAGGQRGETTCHATSAPSTSGPASINSSQARAPKRVRSEEATPPEHVRKAARPNEGRLAFSQVAGSIRVGIRDRLCNLSAEQMIAVQEHIGAHIDSTPREIQGPRFLGCTHRAGWIMFTCANESTRQWLAQVVARVSPWEGSALEMISEAEFPKPHTGILWYPGLHREAKVIANRIAVQNRDFGNTEGWRVLNVSYREGGQIVVLIMDDTALSVLQKQDLVLYLEFDVVRVKVKGPAHDRANRPSEETSASPGMEPATASTSSAQAQEEAAPVSEVATAPADTGGQPSVSAVAGGGGGDLTAWRTVGQSSTASSSREQCPRPQGFGRGTLRPMVRGGTRGRGAHRGRDGGQGTGTSLSSAPSTSRGAAGGARGDARGRPGRPNRPTLARGHSSRKAFYNLNLRRV